MRVYCIYDTVSKESSSLFCANNDEHALRIYRNTLRQERVEDLSEFLLYNLGTYDSTKPLLEGFLVPFLVNTKVDIDE